MHSILRDITSAAWALGLPNSSVAAWGELVEKFAAKKRNARVMIIDLSMVGGHYAIPQKWSRNIFVLVA